MAKKEKITITKEEVGTVEEVIGSMLMSDPKIHFAKYAAKNSVSKNVIAVMSIRNPREMRTEKEWEESIKKEFARTIK